MVYSKRDSKGQESGGDHDRRNFSASNRDFVPRDAGEKHYLKHEYIEDRNALHKTDYTKYQNSINGTRAKDELE
jgi:hypothetical protein